MAGSQSRATLAQRVVPTEKSKLSLRGIGTTTGTEHYRCDVILKLSFSTVSCIRSTRLIKYCLKARVLYHVQDTVIANGWMIGCIW